ncbi:MFS transporter [Teredinibacter purpureus]|uniref:MFS transporter n=1 Tax=Teredinibacter purpureus TaxID=2731756 RepID=UPI0005F800C1|nr:MFS transporter [Teredinibacter purpureus]
MTSDFAKVGIKEKIGYGMGDAAFNFVWMTFIYFGTYFYTDVFGISALTVGSLFLITRLWDTINDPIMGMLADRTETRWGKFRPYMLFGALPLGIVATLCFTTPDISDQNKVIYAYVTYFLVGMVYTILNIPYSSMLPVMTSDRDERNGLSSARLIGAYCAGLIVQFATLDLVGWFGEGDDRLGFQMTMGLYSVIFAILLYFTFSWTKERVKPIKKKHSIKNDALALLSNIPFYVLFFVGIFTLSWVSIRGASIMYYFKYYLNMEDQAKWFMAGFTICNIAGAALTQWICKGRDKKMVYIALMLLNSVTIAVVYWISPDSMILFGALHLANGLLAGPITVIVFSMYADIADYTEAAKGRRVDGLIFSGASFSQKMGWTVGGASGGFLLAFFNYEPNVAQPEETIQGIRMMFTLIPAALSIVAALAMMAYQLSDAKMDEVQQKLKTA